MADVLLFLRQGWKHIWKQNNIFLFSSLLTLTNFLYFFAKGPLEKPVLYIFIPVVTLVFSFANFIGVPYLAYRFLIGNPAGVREALTATKKYWPRVIGCSGLVILIICPVLVMLYFVVKIYSPATADTPRAGFTMISLLVIPFNSIVEFCLFGFFANDDDIGESLKKAWSLFTSHFWTLAILSVILSLLFRGSALLSAVLVMLLENGFDVTSLAKINWLNPALLLTKNILYLAINGVGQIVLMPFNSLVYALAYLKYTGTKELS
jgi:hypothetical protein